MKKYTVELTLDEMNLIHNIVLDESCRRKGESLEKVNALLEVLANSIADAMAKERGL